ncbi:MAG: beta-eliminating lyase-related protein [Deltaproteobacteria bacterium]
MPAASSSERREQLWSSCERFLSGHGPRRIPSELVALAQAAPPDQRSDRYGSGGVLEQLEQELCQRFAKPAALFLPSGTMAQQIALRIHAERAGRRTVAFHPTCHLELHEQRGYSRLHGLDACLVGPRTRLIARTDLEALVEPIAALLLELPQREIGGQLPSWQELCDQCAWARDHGVALHLDGARLWESLPFYGRSLPEVAALFDSIYVSFYKTLGAIAGAALLGDAPFIAEARVWQRRHGGNLVSMYPFALSARQCLEQRLGKIPGYVAHAQQIAGRLALLPGVRVVPDPPCTNLFHVQLPCSGERLVDASLAIAEARKIAFVLRARDCEMAGYCVVELAIGDAASALTLDEIETGFRELLERAR